MSEYLSVRNLNVPEYTSVLHKDAPGKWEYYHLLRKYWSRYISYKAKVLIFLSLPNFPYFSFMARSILPLQRRHRPVSPGHTVQADLHCAQHVGHERRWRFFCRELPNPFHLRLQHPRHLGVSLAKGSGMMMTRMRISWKLIRTWVSVTWCDWWQIEKILQLDINCIK